MKSSWLNSQVKKSLKTLTNASSDRKSSENSEYFPIRRETNEIYDNILPKFSLTPAKKSIFSLKPRVFQISSSRDLFTKRISRLKMNKIPFIVERNEKTLEDLTKISRHNEVDLSKALLNNEKKWENLSKVMCLHKSKYKAFHNSEPLNTRMKFNFNEFLMKKMKSFIDNEGENQKEGCLSDRREKDLASGGAKLKGKICSRLINRRANTAKEEFLGGVLKGCCYMKN